MKAINSKREQYRRDIIKKQKEEFFNKKRQELLRSMQYPEGIINPVEDLRQRNKVKEAFQYLKKKIDESDYIVNIVKFADEGLINVLISFLKQGKQVEETLEIINDILNKKELDYYGTFYNYGLLEYLFNYFQASPKISAQCMNILFSFTARSNDYSEALMINNKHHVIMQETMNRINASRDPQEENLNEGERYYTFTLFMLEELIKIKQSTFDFTEEKLAIFNFIMILVQRRLFLKQTLGFLYQCVNQLQKTSNINRFILPLANTILSQAKIDDKYLYNLYALIYSMMLSQPIDLNFPQFFKNGIFVTKLQKPFVYILGKIVGYGRPYCDAIPTNQEWWERLLMSPESNNLHCQMLKILESLQIKKSWIWKFYSSALSQNSIEVQNESINILNRLIRRPEFYQDILTYLNLHRIPKLLEHLTHTGKSQLLKDSANNLLEYILGPLTEQSSEQAL